MAQPSKLTLAIGGLALALIAVVFLIFRDRSETEATLTADQLSRYEAGTFYRTTVTSTVQGAIADKDWGLERTVTLVHQGEVDFLREVKSVSADHRELIVGLEILSARDLEVRLDLEDAKLDLPPAVGLLGRTAQKIVFTGPAGAAANLASERAAEWLRGDENRKMLLSRLNSTVELITGKGIEEHLLSAKLQPLEAYEGLQADYTYRAGEGLTEFETKTSLSAAQEARVKEFSVYSEAYLLPEPGNPSAKEWEVDVRKIAHLLAPSQDLEVSGTLTFQRGEKTGELLRLNIIRGKVVFSGGSDTKQVLGTWAARGFLLYHLGTHHIETGDLSGDVSLERRSTDHVLFEETFTAEPSYRVVMKGSTSRDGKEARREIRNLEID